MRRQLLREIKLAPARAAHARARAAQARAGLATAHKRWQQLHWPAVPSSPRPPPQPPLPMYEEAGVDFYYTYAAGQPVVAVATPEPPPPEEVCGSG